MKHTVSAACLFGCWSLAVLATASAGLALASALCLAPSAAVAQEKPAPASDKIADLKSVRSLVGKGKFAQAFDAVTALESKYPGDPDIKMLRTEIEAAEIQDMERRESERRRKAFREMKPSKTASFDAFEVSAISTGRGSWAFDRRPGGKETLSAGSGRTFVVADYSLKAPGENTSVPPVGAYYIKGETAYFIAGGITAFREWKSQDSFEGVEPDPANMFGAQTPVKLTSGVPVDEDVFSDGPVLVVLLKSPCMDLNRRTEGAPPLFFKSRDCVFPEALSPDELLEQCVVLGRFR
jgi:hypothetical protein